MPSLEEAIAKLTATIERNNDILSKGITKAASGTTAPAAPATKTTAPAGTKPATKPAAKPKHPSEEDIRSSFGGYLGGVKGAEKAARSDNVRAILAHFGVSTASTIPEESRAEAIGYINTLTQGGVPDFMNEEQPAEEEEQGEDPLI